MSEELSVSSLYDAARKAQKENNIQEAIRLYHEVIVKFPKSHQADASRHYLEQLSNNNNSEKTKSVSIYIYGGYVLFWAMYKINQISTLDPGSWEHAKALDFTAPSMPGILFVIAIVMFVRSIVKSTPHKSYDKQDSLEKSSDDSNQSSLPRTQVKSDIKKPEIIPSSCKDCKYFKKTGIIDMYKGHCNFYDEDRFSNWSCIVKES